jgi:hypothetical protein
LLTRGNETGGTHFQVSRFNNEEEESKKEGLLQNSMDGRQQQEQDTGNEEEVRVGQYTCLNRINAASAHATSSPIVRRPIVPYTSKEDTKNSSHPRDRSLVEQGANAASHLSSYLPFLRNNNIGAFQGNILENSTNTTVQPPSETKKEDKVVRLDSRPCSLLQEEKDEKKPRHREDLPLLAARPPSHAAVLAVVPYHRPSHPPSTTSWGTMMDMILTRGTNGKKHP